MASNSYKSVFRRSNSTDTYYSMNRPKMGFSLILNVEHVIGHSPREGSRTDVNEIKTTLRTIGFHDSDIYEEHDPTEDRINEVLQNCYKKDYKEMNCFIGFILSHGYQEHIKSADDKSIHLNRIFNAFKKNPTLLGKPKIFIIQACRGEWSDIGSTIDLSWCTNEQSDSKIHQRHSTEADVVIAYSSSEGYVSHRHPQHGSVFIQMLCVALTEDHSITSFIEILTKCSNAVHRHRYEKELDLQVPSVVNTLRKKLLLRSDRRENRAGSDEKGPVVIEKPYIKHQYFNQIDLHWNFEGTLYVNDVFEIVFREAENGIWKTYDKTTSDNMMTITGLKAKSKYHFKIRVINHRARFEGKFSEITYAITTKESKASAIMKESKLSQEFTSYPFVYDLPIRPIPSATNRKAKTRKFTLGNESTERTTKTIMFIGATGSGKSTLINAMVNYILGVSWEDDFRFNIVPLQDCENKKRQAQSQTEWITCYQISDPHCSGIEYSVNLIDTPGFSDTSGIDHEDKIVYQIRELFTGKAENCLCTIDALCLIVRDQDFRFTFMHMYEFILSMFGKDIKENICTLVTFADGAKPLVLNSIEALPDVLLPYKTDFAFNNSALYANNTENPHRNPSFFFWNMGIQCCSRFFAHVKTLPPKSLKLTAEVLLGREKLEKTVTDLLIVIDNGYSKFNILENEKLIYTKFIKTIEDNKNFIYDVEETKPERISLEGTGRYAINCLVCNFTCHEVRGIPNAVNVNKARCSVMKDGICTQCPRACHWQNHNCTPYLIKMTTVKVKKKYAELERYYLQAIEKKITQEQVIEKMKKEVQDIYNQVQELCKIINKLEDRLKEIALHPNPLKRIQYIDMLIATEKAELKIGWQSRFLALNICKDHAQYNKTVEKFQTRYQNSISAMSESQVA